MDVNLLIYLAGVTTNLKTLTQIIEVCLIITLCFLVVGSMLRASDRNSQINFKDAFKEYHTVLKNYLRAAFAFLIIQTLIPQKDTFYLMASTSIAKQMANSDEFKTLYEKAFKLLNQKIDESIKEEKKEK